MVEEKREDGFEARPLLFPRERRCARARGLRAEVNDRRAFRDQVARAADGLFGTKILTAVRKGIGRDVDNPHHLRHFFTFFRMATNCPGSFARATICSA